MLNLKRIFMVVGFWTTTMVSTANAQPGCEYIRCEVAAPEPDTLALLAVGILALVFRKKKG